MLLCSSKPFKVFPGKTSDRYLILASLFSYLNFTLKVLEMSYNTTNYGCYYNWVHILELNVLVKNS